MMIHQYKHGLREQGLERPATGKAPLLAQVEADLERWQTVVTTADIKPE